MAHATDNYVSADYNDETPTTEYLIGHYESTLRDMVDTFGANRPFGVYFVMNFLRNQTWMCRKQIEYLAEKQGKPLERWMENLNRSNRNDEFSENDRHKCEAGLARVARDQQSYKYMEVIATKIHDECVEIFNNSPTDDHSERVFSFSRMNAPQARDAVRRAGAAQQQGEEILANYRKLQEDLKNPEVTEVGLKLSELSQMIVDQPLPDPVQESGIGAKRDKARDDIERQFADHRFED